MVHARVSHMVHVVLACLLACRLLSNISADMCAADMCAAVQADMCAAAGMCATVKKSLIYVVPTCVLLTCALLLACVLLSRRSLRTS